MPTPPLASPNAPRWPARLLALTGAAAVLGAVFALYAHPDFMVMLANQIWSCF